MHQAGVWSFRTETGIARVVDGSLRTRYTPRGLMCSVRRLEWSSTLQYLAVGIGSYGLLGPATDFVRSVLIEGSLATGSTFGIISVVALVGSICAVGLPVMFGATKSVDIDDIRTVTVDKGECELTIEYGNGFETTTITAYDDDELDEAIEVLELKGASVEIT